MIIFKNFFSFALTWKAYDWVTDGGIRPTMITIASIQVVVCFLSVPMCKSNPIRMLWCGRHTPWLALTHPVRRRVREACPCFLPSA